MQEFDENSETAVFKPIKDEKPIEERTGNDIYSKKRTPAVLNDDEVEIFEGEDEKSSSNAVLITVASILAVVLVVVIVMGAIFLKKLNAPSNELQEEIPPLNIVEEVEEPLKEEEEEKITTSFYNVVFYGESVIKKEEGYSILADLYDDSKEKTDNRKLYIDSATDIRESGKKMSNEAFLYIIKELGNNDVMFKAEINDENDFLIKIEYKKEVLVKEEPLEETEGEVVEESEILPETVENSVEITSSEEAEIQ